MKLLTTKQLAKKCNYANDAVIRKMILDGKLKASKFGHIWMIKYQDALDNEYIKKRLNNQ